jgi:hypothetical protein
MRKMIEAAWLEYVRLCVTPGTSDADVRALRQTFYTGAAFVFASVAAHCADPDPEMAGSEIEDTLDRLHGELREWGRENDAELFDSIKRAASARPH